MSLDIRDKMHGGCNFENNLNQTNICEFQKHSPIVYLASKTVYCQQYSADFTCFVSLAQGSGTFLAERAMTASCLEYISIRAIQLVIGVAWDHKIF